MLVLVQRVKHASVSVNNNTIAKIDQGILGLCGFEKNDSFSIAKPLLEKVIKYRIFEDKDDKMNLSLKDVKGELLLVPQFTLAADTTKGLRPSFSSALPPNHSRTLFEEIKARFIDDSVNIAYGEFGALMDVSLCNYGPATFLLSL